MSNFKSPVVVTQQQFDSLMRIDKIGWSNQSFQCNANDSLPITTPPPTTLVPSINISAVSTLDAGIDEEITINLSNITNLQFSINMVIELISIDKTGYFTNRTTLGAKNLETLTEGRKIAELLSEIPPLSNSDVSIKNTYSVGEITTNNFSISCGIYNHGHRPFTFSVKAQLTYTNTNGDSVTIQSNSILIKYDYLYASVPTLSRVYNYDSTFASRDAAIAANASPLDQKVAVVQNAKVYEIIIENIPLNIQSLDLYSNTKILNKTSYNDFLFSNYVISAEESFFGKYFYQGGRQFEWLYGTMGYHRGTFTHKSRISPHSDFTSDWIMQEGVELIKSFPDQIEIISSRKIKLSYVQPHPDKVLGNNKINRTIYILVDVNADTGEITVGTGHREAYLYSIVETKMSFHILDLSVNDSYKQSLAISGGGTSNLLEPPPNPEPLSTNATLIERNITVSNWDITNPY